MEIIPYGKNAKKHPDKQIEALAAIVRKVGWRQPVLVNQKGVIVAGHGRYFTWDRYKDELKPIWVMDDTGKTINGEAETTPLSDEDETAYRLADNKLNESPWDMPLVIQELKLLPLSMVDLTGFDRKLVLENDDKDDQVPSVPVKARSQPGDFYELGRHKLFVGDALEAPSYIKLMGGSKADMIFTDPPYNVNYSGRGETTSQTIQNDKMTDARFRDFLGTFFKELKEATKGGAPYYIFHAALTSAAFMAAMNANDIEVKTQLIWNKPTASMGWGDYRWKHEPFFYASLKGQSPVFYGDRTHTSMLDFHKTDQQILEWAKKMRLAETNGKATIWTMKREPLKEYVHPTQKPVELIMYALANSSKVDDIVLDPFGGSGSTMIACQKTNRSCYSIELDPKFADVIVQRYTDFTENRNIKLNGEPILW